MPWTTCSSSDEDGMGAGAEKDASSEPNTLRELDPPSRRAMVPPWMSLTTVAPPVPGSRGRSSNCAAVGTVGGDDGPLPLDSRRGGEDDRQPRVSTLGWRKARFSLSFASKSSQSMPSSTDPDMGMVDGGGAES